MIKQILLKNIPKDVYRLGFRFSFPPGSKDMYFISDTDFEGNLWDFLEEYKRQSSLPVGIMNIEAIHPKRYFYITYYPKRITEEELIRFAQSLGW